MQNALKKKRFKVHIFHVIKEKSSRKDNIDLHNNAIEISILSMQIQRDG